MTGLKMALCKGKKIIICSVNKAVYNTKLITCELSLYLQSSEAQID
jgi:hypothetical protein